MTKNIQLSIGVTSLLIMLLLLSCSNGSSSQITTNTNDSERDHNICRSVERLDTLGLIVLYPEFSYVDLVCGVEPSKQDTSVILFAEAAYTGVCQTNFNHKNIAGDHVSAGKRYRGYKCKRNTGAFVYYNGIWKFCRDNYSQKLDEASKYGGAAFAQELVIYEGKRVPTVRRGNNRNQFRALCEHKGKLCIVESIGIVTFADFCDKLVQYEVSNAIYLDMGGGWNYAWYRDRDSIRELHPKMHDFCTNWITFYK